MAGEPKFATLLRWGIPAAARFNRFRCLFALQSLSEPTGESYSMRCTVSVLFCSLLEVCRLPGKKFRLKGAAVVSATPQKDVLAIDESLNSSQ